MKILSCVDPLKFESGSDIKFLKAPHWLMPLGLLSFLNSLPFHFS